MALVPEWVDGCGVPSVAVPRLCAAKPCARRPAESGAAGRCAGPAGEQLPTRPDRAPPAAAHLDPIEPDSATHGLLKVS